MGIDIDGAEDLQEDLEELEQSLEEPQAAEVGSSADHARPVEFGSDPHTIEADQADSLHFEYEGEEVFVHSVEHPGTEAQPFLRPARNFVEMNAGHYIEQGNTLAEAIQLAAMDAVTIAKHEAAVDDGDLQNSIRWEWK